MNDEDINIIIGEDGEKYLPPIDIPARTYQHEIVTALIPFCGSFQMAQDITDAIIAGEIPHVKAG